MPLSATQVKNAKFSGLNKNGDKLSDERGLHLFITPTGGKLWRFAYRFGGKQKALALGKYPDISLLAARDLRDRARSKLAEDIDPGQEKQKTKAARKMAAENNFESIALEWIKSRKPTWAESHHVRTKRLMERDVFPVIGHRPITDITAPEFLAVARRIEKRGSIDTAHRVLQDCSMVVRYAIANSLAERNPIPDLRGALPTVSGGHFAAIIDPAKFGELLRAIDGFNGTLAVQYALRLAPMVFVRPGELRNAKWADIDLDAATWSYTTSKTGTEHIVPLAQQAVALLRELYPFTQASTYAFPGARTGSRPLSDAALGAALRRIGFGKDEVSVHGFRASARTMLHEVLKFKPEVIEHQLAHRVADVHGAAYNRTKFIDDRREMMQAWADYLDKLKAGAQIVILPAAA